MPVDYKTLNEIHAKAMVGIRRDSERSLKMNAKNSLYMKMVLEALDGYIKKPWTIEHGQSYIHIHPEDNTLTADKFDKLLEKLSKIFRLNPHVSVTKNSLSADYYLKFFKLGNSLDWDNVSVNVYITATNSEKCEVVYVERIVQEAELTGYCKELKDKKYYG